MSDRSSSLPHTPPETLQEALEGRLASLVYIMGGRFSIRHRLGFLELAAGTLTLRDKSGTSLFAVPVETVEARMHRRLFSYLPVYFQVLAADRWWYFQAYAQTKYKRASTRELEERCQLRTLAPRLPGMGVDDYLRRTGHSQKHWILWAACWVQALNIARLRARTG